MLTYAASCLLAIASVLLVPFGVVLLAAEGWFRWRDRRG